MNNDVAQQLNNEENQELTPKKEWNAPELSIITTGKTWSGIGPFADGGLGSES